MARLLLAVIALSTAVEVLEATTSLREERLSFLGISAVGELDLILGLLMLVSGTLVLAGLWTRAAVLGVLLTWWPSFLVPEDGSDWIATLAVGGLAIHLLLILNKVPRWIRRSSIKSCPTSKKESQKELRA